MRGLCRSASILLGIRTTAFSQLLGIWPGVRVVMSEYLPCFEKKICPPSLSSDWVTRVR